MTPKTQLLLLRAICETRKLKCCYGQRKAQISTLLKILWSELDRSVDKRACNSEEELFECLRKAWANRDHGYLAKLIEKVKTDSNTVL